MKLVVTTREISYGGRALRQGEVFEASAKDAHLLKLLKKAADAPMARAPAPARSETAPPTARVRNYRRRDLTAED